MLAESLVRSVILISEISGGNLSVLSIISTPPPPGGVGSPGSASPAKVVQLLVVLSVVIPPLILVDFTR